MLLGESDYEAFSLGKGSQSTLLTIMFSITTFIIMLHLLNMLIAVMGNTFNERAGIALELKYRNHLKIVRTKWYLIDSRFAHLRNTRYLIAACQETIGEEACEHEKEEMDEDKQGNIIQNRLTHDMDWWSDDE